MGNRNLNWPASVAVLSALALGACSTGPGPETRAAPPQQPESTIASRKPNRQRKEAGTEFKSSASDFVWYALRLLRCWSLG